MCIRDRIRVEERCLCPTCGDGENDEHDRDDGDHHAKNRRTPDPAVGGHSLDLGSKGRVLDPQLLGLGGGPRVHLALPYHRSRCTTTSPRCRTACESFPKTCPPSTRCPSAHGSARAVGMNNRLRPAPATSSSICFSRVRMRGLRVESVTRSMRSGRITTRSPRRSTRASGLGCVTRTWNSVLRFSERWLSLIHISEPTR